MNFWKRRRHDPKTFQSNLFSAEFSGVDIGVDTWHGLSVIPFLDQAGKNRSVAWNEVPSIAIN